MSRSVGRRRAVLLLLAGLVIVVGVAFVLGVIGAPTVTDVENRFAGVNQSTTTIATTLTVDNPNPIGIQLGGVNVNYTVTLNEIRMAKGFKEGIAIETGSSMLRFRTALANDRIPPWWVTHIRNDERSMLRVDARVRSTTLGQSSRFEAADREITTDILSSFNSTEIRPVNANEPLVEDPVLYINETGANWGTVTRQETPIDMRFRVYNPKPVPYTITEIGYEITMNNISVGRGSSEGAIVIEPNTARTVETMTVIRNDALDEWWVSHLTHNQVTQLRIDFYARLELPTGTIRLPLDALTYTETIDTDIFGTKNTTATPTQATMSTATRTETPSATATDTTTPTTTESPSVLSTSTETVVSPPTVSPTPTRTPDSSPTPTPTPTDEGLLSVGNETETIGIG